MSTAKVAVYDSRPLEEAGAESIARALAKAWDEENFSDSSSDRRGDLAALWSIGQATIAKLGGTLIKIPIGVGGFFGYVAPGSGNVADQSYPSEIERSIAVAIANVFGWTAAQVEPTGTPAGTVTIGESGPGDLQYSDAAAAAPPAAVLMFAAAFLVASGALLVHEIGGAAAQWTFARNVPTIVDRLLARQEETRVQFLGLAQLVKLTSEHAASEKEAGKRLSWSEGELAGIRAAQEIIQSSINRQSSIVQAKPPTGGTVDEPPGLGAGLVSLGRGLVVVGSVAGLIWGGWEVSKFLEKHR